MSTDTTTTNAASAATSAAPAPAAPQEEDQFSKKKRSSWMRPVAMAKDSNSRAWMMLLSIVCFAIALWSPATKIYWKIRNKHFNAQEELPRTANCFVAISYEGISKDPEPTGKFTTTENFKAQILALKNAGYNPISIEDVRAFYLEKKPLPEKAILLTFENCHKSTYFEIREFLTQVRWRAAVGVVTHKVKSWDDDVLLRPYLKNMALDARWDLVCESDRGTEVIPVSPQGRTALFFSAPKWIAEEKRYEKLAEFTERIEKDHEDAIAEFTNNITASAPAAFFFPKGNYGQFEDNNPVLRETNLDAVARHYDLGFLLNNLALNSADTDRRRLNRMPITPGTTPEELVIRLESSWPVTSAGPIQSPTIGLVDFKRWVPDWGIIQETEQGFLLKARPADDQLVTDNDATGGARAWISGSSTFRDGSIETRFRLGRGEIHFYFRFRADDDWVRIALNDAGRATATYCSPETGSFSIANDAITDTEDFRTIHNLLITVRDDIAYARLDGKLLFKGPLIFRKNDNITSGLVGLGVWANATGLAESEFYSCRIRSRIDNVITWDPVISHDPSYILSELSKQAFRFTVIAPPWIDAYQANPLTYTQVDSRALKVVASSNHNQIYPTVVFHDSDSITRLRPVEIVDGLLEAGANGVLIDISQLSVAKFPILKTWVTELRNELNKNDLKLAIRFPASAASLAAISNFVMMMPEVVTVGDPDEIPPGLARNRIYGRVIIDPPATDADLSLVYQLADFSVASENTLTEPEHFRKAGIKAYSEGRYGDATNHWFKWQAMQPRSAEPWAFLGNALQRLSNTEGAIHAYGESLQLDPGQITLMIERARLQESLGRDEEARETLDLYARAFPEDVQVATAQALWLDRHGNRAAGREIMGNIVSNNTYDIQCRLTYHTLLDDPLSRYRNMHEVLDIGSGGGDSQYIGFAHDIQSSELLTMPESSVFFEFLRNTATNAPSEGVRELYSDFLPLETPITEKFNAERLSENWIALGTPLSAIAGAYDLRAASDMSEAYLRLKKSELIRDGFIEVTIGESVGAFWLYARRSSRAMIRFGFDSDGFVRIQTWQNGETRTTDSRAWIRPTGDITLRLEVRGDGAIGKIDGKTVFTNPLQVPHDIAYGWWSVAPFSPELGIARARIGYISAGPLNPTIAILRETDSDRIATCLDKIRPAAGNVSAVAPVLFVQAQDGDVLSTPLSDIMAYRMFCAYHRLRLMPVVSLDFYSDVVPEKLVDIIIEHRLQGLILLVRSMPPEKWFEKMTEILEQTSAHLLVIQSEKPLFGENAAKFSGAEYEGQVVTLREIQRGSVLLQPTSKEWTIPVTEFDKWDQKPLDNLLSPLLLRLRLPEEKKDDTPPEESIPRP